MVEVVFFPGVESRNPIYAAMIAGELKLHELRLARILGQLEHELAFAKALGHLLCDVDQMDLAADFHIDAK